MGCDKPLEAEPGHLFDPTETDDALSLLIASLEFSWDCFIADASQKLMCFASHDEFLIIMSTSEPFLSQVGSVLESAKWCQRLPK